MKKLATKYAFILLSDIYRAVAAILDWRCHIRVLSGRPKYDVACITNFENRSQKYFMGIRSRKKVMAYGLRFSLGSSTGRYILINSTASDLTKSQSKEIGKHQARIAIMTAINEGARVILFAAGTKRLFSEEELAEIRKDYPSVVFTIGDNGTAWALLADVMRAIEINKLSKSCKILILGPNGFLGSIATKVLKALGYTELNLLSSKLESPFDGIKDTELVIACSHKENLKLTEEILERIGHEKKVYVVDVCKPSNLSKKEFAKCKKVVRQDAGIVYNRRIKYVFSLGALLILFRLRLSLNRLYGCFSETVAISTLPPDKLRNFDFLNVNRHSMELLEQVFKKEGFEVSPIYNFGKEVRLDETVYQPAFPSFFMFL